MAGEVMLTSTCHWRPNFDSLLQCLEVLKLSCFLPAKISCFRHLWPIPGQTWDWKEKSSQTHGPKQWGIDAIVIRGVSWSICKTPVLNFAWLRLERAFLTNQTSVLSSTYWLSCTELRNASPFFLAFWISYGQKVYHDAAFWQNLLVLMELPVFNSKKEF